MSELVQRAKPLYIFDLDGTLADCQHRVPILAEKDDPNRWRRFYAACVDDTPIMPVIGVLHEEWRQPGRSAIQARKGNPRRHAARGWPLLRSAPGHAGCALATRGEGGEDRGLALSRREKRGNIQAFQKTRCFGVGSGDRPPRH